VRASDCELAQMVIHVAVVHVGGAALTRTLKSLGKKSDFVDGLRITDARPAYVALMVLSGVPIRVWSPRLWRREAQQLGYVVQTAWRSARAKAKNSNWRIWGFVGEICYAEPRWIEAIWAANGIPVLSSIRAGSDGEYYNINADQMASACAVACHAD